MPLDPSLLRKDIEAVFKKTYRKPRDSAKLLAKAYFSYASAATFGGSLPTFTGSEMKALEDKLEAVMGYKGGTPIRYARAWADGVAAFWTAPPIAVAGAAGAGTVSTIPGTAALVISLVSVFSNTMNTAESCAAGMASALHTATMTTIATLTLPPASPAPVPIS